MKTSKKLDFSTRLEKLGRNGPHELRKLGRNGTRQQKVGNKRHSLAESWEQMAPGSVVRCETHCTTVVLHYFVHLSNAHI